MSLIRQGLLGKFRAKSMNQIVDNVQSFRTPADLSVSQHPISRWLVIGSCLSSGFPSIVEALPGGAQGDYIIFNNAANLPASPPRPVDSYDLIFIQIPLRSVVRDLAHARLAYDDIAGFSALFEEAAQRLALMFEAASRYSRDHGITTVVSTLIPPQMSSIGRVMGGRDLRCFTYFVDRLNDELHSLAASIGNMFVVDLGNILRTYGSKYFQDDFLWQLNHAAAVGDNDISGDQQRLHPVVPVSQQMLVRSTDFVIAMWNEIVAIYQTVKRTDAVKLVIFDLDDTLWRGVVAEMDEPDPTSLEGWPLGVAEAALYLKQRGIVIAIASKNDEGKIRAVWDSMWQGRLFLDDFAVIKINWRSKSENVSEIISEVNVLPDSVVFVDDNPLERDIVASAHPGIRTLGSNLYDVRRILLWSAQTQPATMTSESAQRNQMIQGQVRREAARSATADRGAFIASLQIQQSFIWVDSIDHSKFERVFELLNKTNQFNTTGRRWSIDEINQEFIEGARILAFEVEDKFTRYGLVGLALIRSGVIEQFVMSCRVIGLDVELACIAHLQDEHTKLSGIYVDTGKNFLSSDLFERAGFSREESGSWMWRAS